MKTEQIQAFLEELGFGQNESKIYLELSRLGQAKAGDIIQRTGLHRHIVYESLKQLEHKHLVSTSHAETVAVFQAADPKRLLEQYEGRRNVLEQVVKELREQSASRQSEVEVYKGVEGLKLMMERSLEFPEHWFIGGNAGINRVMPEYWLEYNRRRIEKKIWWHDLIQPTYVLPGFEDLIPGQKNTKQYLEFKYLSQEMNSPMVVYFWGNCVVHINWDAKIAFLMEDEQMFKSYRAYFDFLWNQDTFITRGLDKVRDLFYRKAEEMRAGEEYAVLWGTYGVETRKEMIPWFEKYNRFRIERGLHLRLVMFEEDKKLVEREMSKAGDSEFKLTHMRFSKEKDYGSPMQINIYPDSVVLFTFAPGDRATAIEIKGKENRDAMRKYFDGLWRQLKQ